MKSDYRVKPRRKVQYRAWLQAAPGAPAQPCRLFDASEGGARLQIDGAQAVPAEVNLMLSERSAGRPCQVIWRSETEIGLRFYKPATGGNARLKR